ncbi:MAG: hypothetical protein AAGI66_00630 [Cyanobacteria bacterium P01_H01_bin.74]
MPYNQQIDDHLSAVKERKKKILNKGNTAIWNFFVFPTFVMAVAAHLTSFIIAPIAATLGMALCRFTPIKERLIAKIEDRLPENTLDISSLSIMKAFYDNAFQIKSHKAQPDTFRLCEY